MTTIIIISINTNIYHQQFAIITATTTTTREREKKLLIEVATIMWMIWIKIIDNNCWCGSVKRWDMKIRNDDCHPLGIASYCNPFNNILKKKKKNCLSMNWRWKNAFLLVDKIAKPPFFQPFFFFFFRDFSDPFSRRVLYWIATIIRIKQLRGELWKPKLWTQERERV